MKQLTGFIDHWAPSHEQIDLFWRTPFATLAPLMAELTTEIGINHVTFYTKWFSNGLYSRLPFLRNHPAAQNTLTKNDWGRQWIEFLHERGLTVGAMLQCYWFEEGALPREAVLRSVPQTRLCTGFDRDNEVADPLWEGYDAWLTAMLEEQLREFPGLDAIFLEFEGLGGPLPDGALGRLAGRVTVSAETRAQWDAAGWPVPASEHWIWTPPVQAALAKTLQRRLATAQRVLDSLQFRGVRGVVYHALSYETPFVVSALPDASWWLLPWHYWSWDWDGSGSNVVPAATQRQQIRWCCAQWRQQIQAGHPVCYIGNATLPTTDLAVISELAAACVAMGASYLGMGNPIPTYGLRWHQATDESVAEIRSLYRRLFPPRSAGSGSAG